MKVKTHTANFNPQSRILDLLGEQLIGNHRIALSELIKNAYDADAPEVSIVFYNIQNGKKARLEIRDNGEGMDLDSVLHKWLEPASDHQSIKRKNGERTQRFKRLPLGEKGVGRFAIQKLGKKATIISRKKGYSEIKIDINWDDLAGYKYLSDVPIEVIEQEPVEFSGNLHGTLICIEDLKHNWTRNDVRRLYRSILSMISPSVFISNDPFKVNFEMIPDPGWLTGLFSPEDAEQFALFHFEFELNDHCFKWQYKFTPFSSLMADFKDEIKPREKIQDEEPAFEFFKMHPPSADQSINDSRWSGRKERKKPIILSEMGIGPISGKLTVFDLDRELKARYIQDSSGLAAFLKEQGGMRVYRDGMRVYDYGEPGRDWLELDVRRVQTPARHLSNNLLLGEIHLKLENSYELKEKTNREGFIENEAYVEFRYAILCILTTFEAERQKDKDIIRNCLKLSSDERKAHIHGPEEAIDDLRRKVLQEGLDGILGKYVNRVDKLYKEAREILMSAVGAGLGLAVVFHEIERGVRSLHKALEDRKPVEIVIEMSDNLVTLLEGAAYLVKKNPPESFNASTLVQQALFTLESRFKYHKITLINGFDNLKNLDFSIRGSRRMLLASLANIIDNSIYWVNDQKKSKSTVDKYIWIGPSHDLEWPAIVIADNGPGFQDSHEDLIKPFFTRRLEGMGLGLYYANMAMKINNGRLTFPDKMNVKVPDYCTGAIVAMVFNYERR